MIRMQEKYLPIGTVVLLKDGTKKVMITGYKSKQADDTKVYDYNGCIFPEGFIENVYCLFNHDEIEDVYYRGLENNESDEYIQKITDGVKLSASTINGKPANEVTSTMGKGRRTRTAPTHPMSISEMRSKYGIKKSSDENLKHLKDIR